ASDNSAPQVLDAVQKKVRRCLVMWSPALDWCLLACGGIDALVSIDSSLEDQVAGTLIAQEAGCIVRSVRNEPYVFPERRIVASNSELHAQVQGILGALR
ncbi:MAG: hypothetical protein J0M12_13540, partial [Deltaproteobacteria bacterium]|nr:hypothetical protein [Deltaproteobacteria bacterium]